jgi:hypothetical protein
MQTLKTTDEVLLSESTHLKVMVYMSLYTSLKEHNNKNKDHNIIL